MSKIVNLNFQELINGWEIEIVDGDEVIEFSLEEDEKSYLDDGYFSLNSLLSDLSYEDNKEYWDDINDGKEEDQFYEFDYDEFKIIEAVQSFFNDNTLKINIRTSQDDS